MRVRDRDHADGHRFTSQGIENCTELDWWDEREIWLTNDSDTTVTSDKAETEQHGSITAKIGCLPCQHTSGRSLADQGRTLWGSWSVESGGKNVYFAG